MREEVSKKIDKLLEDESFVTVMSEAKDDEAVLKLFKERGVELTAEEVSEITASADREIGETELENVAGGCITVGGLVFASWLAYQIWRMRHRR